MSRAVRPIRIGALRLGLLAMLAAAFTMLALAGPAAAKSDLVLLTGRDLTIDQVERVARGGARVEIAPDARALADKAFRVLLVAAGADLPIYGLNRGVGEARQVQVLRGDVVDPEVRAQSEAFNRTLLISHSEATGPEAPREVVRAAMLARLNTALVGAAGLRTEVLDRLVVFLNRDITPILRTRGSVGEADIYILPPIGLAAMGIGEVVMGDERIPAAEALRRAGLAPLKPWAKDALGLLSSNAYSAGQAALATAAAERLLDRADQAYALSLEALNGNVAPLLPASLALRPYPQLIEEAARLRELLAGSALWSPDPERYLQDPLSVRTTPAIHGAARRALARLKQSLLLHLNSAEDNPAILVDAVPAQGAGEQERRYYVAGSALGHFVTGAVIPSAHFDPTFWSLDIQALAQALVPLATASARRGDRLASGDFTKLRLEPPLTAMSLVADSLLAELVSLSGPILVAVAPTSRDIEDIGTGAPLGVRRAGEIVDLAYRILAIEVLVGARLVELRREAKPGLALGRGSTALLAEIRARVPPPNPDQRGGEVQEEAYRLLREPAGTTPEDTRNRFR